MISKIDKVKNFKLYLCYNSTIDKPLEIENNPISKLIKKFDEIKQLEDVPKYLKFLYFNRKIIHQILYDEEEIIYIDDINDNDLCSYIYLSFLIDDNTNVVNYKYPFKLISKIYNIHSKEDIKNNIKVILLEKIILNLIQNFEQNEDDIQDLIKYKKELTKFKSDNNNKIISSNKDLLKDFDLTENDIKTISLEKLICQIIKFLIIKDILNETDETYKIIKALELKTFNITRNILDDIKILFDEEKDYINKYKIKKFEDIFKKENIIFYYMLFNYILKNNIYIYEIPFLLKTRNNIIKYIKKNIEKLNENVKSDKSNKDKVEFILEFFTNNYKYYSDLCIKKLNERNNLSQNSSIGSSINLRNNQFLTNNYVNGNNSSYNNSFFSSPSYINEKERSGRSLDNFEEPQKDEYSIIKEKYSNEAIFNILDYSFFKFHTNKKESNPRIIYDEITFQKNKKITIDEIKELTSNNEVIMHNYKKLLLVLSKIEDAIKNEFIYNYKITVTLNFKTISVNNSVFNIRCTYNLIIPNENKPFEFADDNIIEKGLSNGLEYLISEINNEIYSYLSYEE